MTHSPLSTKAALAGAALLLASNSLFAQAGAISSYEVLKLVDYEQTSSTAPTTPITDGYTLELFLSIPPSPTFGVTTPNPTVDVQNPSPSSVGLNLEFDEWALEDSQSSQGALDALYGNGNYTFNVNLGGFGPVSETLTLNPDASGTFFAAIPTVTSFTNAVWNEGTLVADITGGVLATINFNGTGITGFGSAGSDSILVGVEPQSGGDGEDIETSSALGSFTIGDGGSFDLAPGLYDLEIEFLNVVDDQTGFGGTAEGVAGYSNITTIALEVIPEPSAFALLMGGLALALGVFKRRR